MKHLHHLLLCILPVFLLTPHAFAIADKDGDGMSDLWEETHGFSTSGNANPNQAANADPDGDGVSNLLESVAGTNPHLGSGWMGLHQVHITHNLSTAGAFDLEWQQLTGKEYRLWTSPNFNAASWIPCGPAEVGVADALSGITVQPSTNAATMFFRVSVNDIDPDSDSLSSHEESQIGTNVSNPDSDGDEMFDGYEYRYGGLLGLNPGDDLDTDSLNNLAEFLLGSNPQNADTDGDQTSDAAEVEQETSPSSPSDLGAVDGGKIRLRVGTGTFLGPTYPYPAYPAYPINIYRRDLTTGVETLLHSVPTINISNAQNIDLPNDGSVYSLQVNLPNIGTSVFDQQFKDFTWFCQCFTRAGSAPVAIIDRFSTTTNAFGTSGRLLGTPPQAYNSGFRQFRALIIPVNVDYLTRDTQTGVVSRTNAIVEGSDVRPEVKITNVSTVIQPLGQLEITLSGTARDPMSEVLGSGAGAVQSLDVYVDGDLVETLTDFTPQPSGAPVLFPWLLRDSTVAFQRTITVAAAPGMRSVRVYSNANALGKKGTDGVTVLVEKPSHAPVPLANVPNFDLTLPATFTAGVDSITVTSGAASAVLTEDASAPNSGLFSGTLVLAGESRDIGVQLPASTALNPALVDQLPVDIFWRLGGQTVRLDGIWIETAPASGLFSPAPTSLSSRVNGVGNLSVAHIQNDPNPLTRDLNPTAMRIEVPSNFDFFGASGLLTATLNGSPATFHEVPAALPYPPPTGKKWFYLGAAGAPNVFVFNSALNGTAQAPSAMVNAGKFDLTMRLRSSNIIAFQEATQIQELSEIAELKFPPAPASFQSFSQFGAAEAPPYTMEEVRFWFELFFDDAGKVLLDRYESGIGSDDGLVISLQNFWIFDGETYSFKNTLPIHQSEGAWPSLPQLYLNQRILASPMDAAVALYHALQELRSATVLRSGLVVGWTGILDDYLSGATADPNIEQSLRNARLAPIKDVLTAAKTSFEIGFSFIPGADLVIDANDTSEQLAEGNIKGAAVAVAVAFTPKILERIGGYCIRQGKKLKLSFGPAGVVDVTTLQLSEITTAGLIGRTKTRAQKMEAVQDLLSRDAITREQIEMLYEAGELYLHTDTSRKALRANLTAAGSDGIGKAAHHDLPLAQKYQLEKEFVARGIDPNLAENGRFIDHEKHRIIHGKGTTGWLGGDPFIHQWRKFFDRTPGATADQIHTFRDELRALTAGDVTNADLIAWPFSKTD